MHVSMFTICEHTVFIYISHSESPGPPSDLRVSNVTNTSAILSWSPPDNDGGRPLYEIVYTIIGLGTFPGGHGVVDLLLTW